MTHIFKRALPALFLLAVLPLVAACTDSQATEITSEGEEGEEKKEEASPVEVATLATGEIEALLRFSTNLEAEEAVAVYSQSARQVRQLLVEEGDTVQRGQLLLRLQDAEQRTTLAKVESQLERARREHRRMERLFDQELVTEQAFNDSLYEVEQLELGLEEAQRELSYTEVKAPIYGTITARHVSLGDTVTVNQHLFDMVDFESIVARVFVPEKELSRLRVGQQARIFAPARGQDAFRGRIDRMAPIVDPQSGTVKVTVDIAANQGLLPGMYVDVALVTAVHEEAVLVPKRALIYDNEQVFVYRLGDDRKVERIDLEPLLEDRLHVEPAGDRLRAGDRLVVAGQAGLKDGAAVRLIGESAASDAAATAAAETGAEAAVETGTETATEAGTETATEAGATQ